MRKNAAKEFVTSDAYLASAIKIMINQHPSFMVENGRVFFIYPLTGELCWALYDYNNGFLIGASDYAQTIKSLKAEMLLRRNSEVKQ